MYTVSITSQKQISIPVKIWEELFRGQKNANVYQEDNRMIVEPIPDLLDLAGSLHKYAKKGLSLDQISKLEHEAIGDAIVERYIKKEARSKGKLYVVKP